MPSTRTASILLLASLMGSASAHMELTNPPPLRSQSNPQYSWDSYDYSMTAPLSADGSNFVCKGYQSDVPSVSHAVTTLKAGQSFTASVKGTAVHGGGSCQFSLSYDGGKTFGVIHSVIGGCPLQSSYTFKIPEGVPSGKNVLFGWTWFNKVGNREMYMNCAAIDIESSATQPLKVPRIFEANVFGAGTCNTVEGDELAFPNPGDSVEYGGMWSSSKPGSDALKITNCPDDKIVGESSFVTLISSGGTVSNDTPEKIPDSLPTSTAASSMMSSTASAGLGRPRTRNSSSLSVSSTASSSSTSPSASSDAAVPTPSASEMSIEAEKPAITPSRSSTVTLALSRSGQASASLALGRSRTATSTLAATKVSSTPAVSAEAPSTATCSGSDLVCSGDGKTFSICSSGSLVNMGAVAPGTICKNGAIALDTGVQDRSADKVVCSPNHFKCTDGGSKFSVCNTDGTAYTDMGNVAPGTECKNGAIGLSNAASTRRTKHKRRMETYRQKASH